MDNPLTGAHQVKTVRPRLPALGDLADAIVQGAGTLRAHPLRASLSAAAMAVAVATQVLVAVSLDGIATSARSSAARAFGSDTFVLANVAAPGSIDRRELARRLARNPAITRGDLRFLLSLADGALLLAPTTSRDSDVSAGARRYDNARVVGTSASLERIRDLGIASGRFFREEEETAASQVAVVGAEIAEALFPASDPLGAGIRIAGRRFLVIGVQAPGGTVGGSNLDRDVWIPLPTFERAFGAAASLQILARAADPDPSPLATSAAEDLARTSMRARRRLAPGVEDTFDLLIPEAARGFVLALSARVGLAAGPIAAMALLAAIVVVTNTTLVSVTQRIRDIGVRRAVGASRGRVLGEVLAEAVEIALIGGALGLLAVAALLAAARGAGLELYLRPVTAIWALAAAALGGLVAGLYPALRATRVAVVDALRSE